MSQLNPTREDFAALLAESLTASDVAEGTVVKGTIVAIEKDLAVIDVGLKVEGRVPLKEFGAKARDGELKVGDRVVVPFNISCGHCWMCSRGLFAQCETTQNTEQGKGASLFGYTSLYGAVPGGQAEYLFVPYADFQLLRFPDQEQAMEKILAEGQHAESKAFACIDG